MVQKKKKKKKKKKQGRLLCELNFVSNFSRIIIIMFW